MSLSRIMAITQSAGVDVPYSELMAKPDITLIVDRPRTEWRHLFERPEGCTIPPEGWTCSRTHGHDGPCAASPSTPIPVIAEAGEREAAMREAAAKVADAARCAVIGIPSAAQDMAAKSIAASIRTLPLSTPATLDNTAVEGQEAISDATHEALWAADAENERLRAVLTRIEQFVRDFRTPWGSWKTAWWEGEVSDDAALTEDNALMHIANIASATLTAKTEKAG